MVTSGSRGGGGVGTVPWLLAVALNSVNAARQKIKTKTRMPAPWLPLDSCGNSCENAIGFPGEFVA